SKRDWSSDVCSSDLADLRGRELATARSTLGGTLEGTDVEVGAAAAEVRVETVRRLLDQVLEEAGAAGRRRLLTVVGVPAPVDAEDRKSVVEGKGVGR